MFKLRTILAVGLMTQGFAENIQQELTQNSVKHNIKKVQASLEGQSKQAPQGIPTQKSTYTVYLDWQKPNKCVDAVATALAPHYSWRLFQKGRDQARYRVPRTQVESSIESLKSLAPLKVFVENSNVSQNIVNNASRYVAIDTLTQYYFQAIEESEQAIVISELSEALDELENERNRVIQSYLKLRLETQSAQLEIVCTPFAPPIEGEAKVAVPWLNNLGIHQLEGEF